MPVAGPSVLPIRAMPRQARPSTTATFSLNAQKRVVGAYWSSVVGSFMSVSSGRKMP